MECPHCGIDFADEWNQQDIRVKRGPTVAPLPYKPVEGVVGRDLWATRVTACTRCGEPILDIGVMTLKPVGPPVAFVPEINKPWQRIFPRIGKMKPLDLSIGETFAQDYREADIVLDVSTKASAALSR
jgi:hypothetical protein